MDGKGCDLLGLGVALQRAAIKAAMTARAHCKSEQEQVTVIVDIYREEKAFRGI